MRPYTPRWPPLLVAGLTGGIASGKTTVAGMFRALGAHVIHADDEGREVVTPGEPALAEVTAAFGAEYLLADGSLDRRRLGDRVFSRPAELRRLNRITHPRIRERVCKKLRKLAVETTCPTVVILEAAILIEAGWADEVDRIIVVAAQPSTQVARLMAGSKLSRAQAEARVRSQLPLQTRLRHADFRIDGEVPLTETVDQVSAVWAALTGLAQAPAGHPHRR